MLVPNHGTIRPDNSAIAQTRDYLNWLTRTLDQSADSGLDMTEVMALRYPRDFPLNRPCERNLPARLLIFIQKQNSLLYLKLTESVKYPE